VGDAADGRYDTLHKALLESLQALHDANTSEGDGPDVIFLEGMLQALERDLGEALAHSKASPERTGLLLSFAQEHLAMRSASSLTRCRTAYTSHRQIELRLRFLQSSAGPDCGRAKLLSVTAQPGLTEEEVQCRQAFETDTLVLEEDGFVVPGGWRDCVLGLGLFVHPRRLADRRKGLPPQIDLVAEYVSAEAYNLGVRASVQHVVAEEAAGDESDGAGSDAECEGGSGGAPLAAATSPTISRQRVNGWLPLYINEANWQTARTFAPSAFSLLATQLNAAFQPGDALRVCARLMCCAVVGFVHPTKDTGVPDHSRAPASERAIQMYCDVHRLFLEMVKIYPEIKATALEHVQGFIASPEQRTRRSTPDLGNLIAYLSILDEVQWLDLALVFVPEMVRRAFVRFSEPFCPESCGTLEELICRFDALEPDHGLVTLFNVIFNSLVARPSEPWSAALPPGGGVQAAASGALSCEEVCDMYDRRWGQLPVARCQAVSTEVCRIRRLGSVAAVLRELLPVSFGDADVGELLLWCAKLGNEKKAIRDVPDLRKMPRTMSQEWALRVKLRQGLVRGLHRSIAQRLPPRECLQKLLKAAVKVEDDVAEATKQAALERVAVVRKGGKTPEAGGVGASAAAPAQVVKTKQDPKRQQRQQPVELCKEDMRAAEQAAQEHRKPFNLQVVMCPEGEEGRSWFVLTGVSYGRPGQLTTGWDLRTAIASKTGADARKMRLLVRRASGPELPATAEGSGSEPEALGDGGAGVAALSNSSPLALWQLAESNNITVEVHPKHRGGKKLGRPGNGWHKQRKAGNTYAMGIAGAIVRDTVFSGVCQYYTLIHDGRCLDTLLGLVRTCESDAVVLCSEGTAPALQHELLAIGGVAHGTAGVQVGKHRLILVEEVEVPADQPESSESERRGEPEATTLPVPCEVWVPPEAAGARLVVTYGSPLREAASLARVIWSVRRRGTGLEVFHLVSDLRTVLVGSVAERDLIAESLGEDRLHLGKDLQLAGAQPLPKGSALATASLPSELPSTVCFRLRSFGLGFVVRLRQRFGLQLTEVFYDALRKVVEYSVPEPEPAVDDDWVTV